jgi:hypothetical protein
MLIVSNAVSNKQIAQTAMLITFLIIVNVYPVKAALITTINRAYPAHRTVLLVSSAY